MQQPAYVEPWDSLDFPTLDVHSSDTGIPLFHQRVALVLGTASAGTPDAGEESWIVLKGHPLVAKKFCELAGGDQDVTAFNEWVSESQSADDNAKRWRRKLEVRLSEYPALLEAFNSTPEALFDQAGLSVEQFAAMRLFWRGDSRPYIAAQLGIDENAVRMRIDRAMERLLALAAELRASAVPSK